MPKYADELSKEELAKEQKERLDCYKVFDYSDIRINVDETDKEGSGFVLARTHKDHIELIAKSWISEFRFLEKIIQVINHEHLHVPIDRILMEDGFGLWDFDGEWYMYAGGMDEMFGMSSSNSAPTYYLNTEAIKNTLKMFPTNSFQCRETLHGDYDL